MNETSYKLSVIAFYLSKFNLEAVHELGYKTWREAFENISETMGRPNNYLKLRRDEFDALIDNGRKGWGNRTPVCGVKKIYNELSSWEFIDLTIKVKAILEDAAKALQQSIIDGRNDGEYISQVNHVVCAQSGTKNWVDHPIALKNKSKRVEESFRRDPQVVANALCNANYKCEICESHETFIRKSTNKPYMEPHHLVPMRAQDRFNVSLDVENNIVSLCCNCHNHLHYGREIDPLLKSLFEKRKEFLLKAGISISYEELKNLY